MDELVVDGEKYISSKRAARLSGYTKDYIGQLCRAGKIPSKMVGRSWYVKEEALKEHRKEYQGEPVIDPGLWEERSKGSIFRGFGSTPAMPPKPRLTEEHIKISYEPDPRPLIPTVSPRVATAPLHATVSSEPVAPRNPVDRDVAPPKEVFDEVVVKTPMPSVTRVNKVYRGAPRSVESSPKELREEDTVVVIESSSPRRYRIIETILVVLVLVCGLLLLFEKEDTFSINRSGSLDLESSGIGFWNVVSDVMRWWSE